MRFWRNNKAHMSIVLALTVITIGLKTGFPILLKLIVDQMQGKFDLRSIHSAIWLYFFVGIIHELFSRMLPLSRARMNFRIAEQVRTYYYNVFTKKGYQFFQNYRTGDLLTRLTDDIDGAHDRIAWFGCSGIMRPIEAVLVLGFSLTVMCYYSWELTLWSFLPLPFLVVILSRAQDRLVNYAEAKQEAVSACNNLLETCLSGIRVVKSTQSEADQVAKYQQALDERVQREKDFLRINQLVHLFSMLTNHCGTIIVVIVGSYFTIAKKIDLGTFLLFVLYLERLVEPVWTLCWSWASSKQIMKYSERLSETEELEDDYEYFPFRTNLLKSEEFTSLVFQDVTFEYPSVENSTLALKPTSFTLHKGEILAVVGEVGAGKTTLLELVAKNLTPTSGRILLNGVDTRRLSSEELALYLGYVRQESVLFSETIIQNIMLGNSFTESEIHSALETAQLLPEVVRFDSGLESRLGQKGISLSGGQKQRLSIARTLVRAPQLLLLDDCTAAMDAGTESRFWQAFKRKYPDTACIVVTHREQTVKYADKVLNLENTHTPSAEAQHAVDSLLDTMGLNVRT
ncbi:MAG: ABC transporter ATP-binding protein [Candidatus Kapaibacterium sp.]